MSKFISAAFLGLVLVSACHSGSTVSLNGNYNFDTEALKTTFKNSSDEMIKGMPEDVLAQVVDGMKSFHIEVKDTEATATFGETVVKGTLSKAGEVDGETKFVMTPVDEDKKSDTVTIFIKGDTLTLDPGKKDIDKMFFKKEAAPAK